MADKLIDIWSGFDHKEGDSVAPTYVNDIDTRRIDFYARARAYIETVGRHFLKEDPNDPDKEDEWQEFGDPAVIVEQRAGAIIGDTITYRVVGADDSIPKRPDYDDPPEEPDTEGLTPEQAALEARIHEIELNLWTKTTEAIVERWAADIEIRPFLLDRQDWLRDWATSVKLTAVITENEIDNIVALGSGVYEMGWDPSSLRTNIEIIPPEFYFPVLSDGLVEEFPDKVFICYPIEDGDRVRRVTYELVRISGSSADLGDPDVETIAAPGSAPLYHGEGDEFTHVCLKSDEIFEAADFKDLYDDSENGTSEPQMAWVAGRLEQMVRFPISLDFIPVVHIPNTLSRKTHFGRSAIARLAQLLDEIAATDGDESLASRWAGQPPVGVSGMAPGAEELDLTPGRGIRLGENGSISTVPMAENLQQVGERLERLQRRLSSVSSIPDAVRGTADIGSVASGKLLSLSFVAFEQMVKRARMARDKYSLIPKFAQRIAIQNGGLTDTAVYDAEIVFGPYMPSDLAELADILKILMAADLISQETGLKMLQEAGVPSGTVDAELAAIRAIMVQHADMLTSALEDPKYAAEFLGRDDYDVDDGIDPDADNVTVPVLAATGA